jgi:hypothetical protein
MATIRTLFHFVFKHKAQVPNFKLIKPKRPRFDTRCNQFTTQQTSKALDKQENRLSMSKPLRGATKEEASQSQGIHLLL